VSGDASETALLKYVQITFGNAEEFRKRHLKVAEIPFHPSNKYHLSIHENESKTGYLLLMKGAPETIFDLCSTVLIHGSQVPVNRCQFHQHFTSAYIVEKCFAKLFSNGVPSIF